MAAMAKKYKEAVSTGDDPSMLVAACITGSKGISASYLGSSDKSTTGFHEPPTGNDGSSTGSDKSTTGAGVDELSTSDN
jgi:hypothetical protein